MSSTAVDLDQNRGDIAVAASRNERSNRPTHLVIIAIGLTAIALVFLLFAIKARSGGLAELAKEKKIGTTAAELVAQLREIKSAEASTSVRYGKSETELLQSKFSNAAAAAGLKQFPPVYTRKPQNDRDIGGVHRTKVGYDVRDESMPNLMKWVQNVVRDTPGLEVYSIQLKPEATGWFLKVTFSRWERTEPK